MSRRARQTDALIAARYAPSPEEGCSASWAARERPTQRWREKPEKRPVAEVAEVMQRGGRATSAVLDFNAEHEPLLKERCCSCE